MTRALRAVHSSFYLSAKTVSIGVIGPGSVGSALLDQLASANASLRGKFNFDLRIRAIGGSKRMLLEKHHIELVEWRKQLAAADEMHLTQFVDHVQTDYLPHAVIDRLQREPAPSRIATAIGCAAAFTSSRLTSSAHSGPMLYYEELKRSSRPRGRTSFTRQPSAPVCR